MGNRLTEKNDYGEWRTKPSNELSIQTVISPGGIYYYTGKSIKYLARLESDLEQGRSIHLPIKLGGRVYALIDGEIYPCKVTEVRISENRFRFLAERRDGDHRLFLFDESEIGEKVFRSYEKAKRKNGN